MMRFSRQLQRTKSYLETVIPTLQGVDENESNLQFCFRTIVLMVHCFMEEHYRLLVSLASLWRPEDVRRHLAARYPDQAERYEETPAFQLMRQVVREVSFRDDARKLKAVFSVLFSIGPFADEDAEAKCLDLIRVRNILTHQGGLIEDDDLPQLHSPDVVVKRKTDGTLAFRDLHIQPVFLLDVLAALGRSVAAIDESLKRDPRYCL